MEALSKLHNTLYRKPRSPTVFLVYRNMNRTRAASSQMETLHTAMPGTIGLKAGGKTTPAATSTRFAGSRA